ncbi:MAG: hypothetical protein V5A22_07525 [Salinivenus sp.]
MGWWLGIGIGVGIMCGYAALRVWVHRLSGRRTDAHAGLIVELGGLVGRMFLVLAAVGAVLAFVPVHVGAFVGTVLAILVLSVAAEMLLVARRTD